MLLDRRVWPSVAAGAVGDEGARDWLRARRVENPDDVLDVECGDLGDPTDLDTPEQLDALAARPPTAGPTARSAG